MAGGSSSAGTVPTDLRSRFSREKLQELRKKITILCTQAAALGMDREKVYFTTDYVMDEIDFLEEKLIMEGQVAHASRKRGGEGVVEDGIQLMSKSKLNSRREAAPHECLAQLKDFRSSVNEDGTNELRYLFVSNGCAICLLDLKQASSDISHTPPLPKIATQNLIEKGLPVSVGLFKLQSEAYMIGGEDFVAYSDKSIKHNPSSYAHLCSRSFYHRGKFRSTYRLSAVDNGTISLSECHITKMNAPKIWPIVEEIHGALHVFDCDPSWNSNPTLDWIFSHEVLEREGDRFCWHGIPTSMGVVDSFIRAHLVLGHCIYALAGQKALLFDSRKGRWEERKPVGQFQMMSKYDFRTAWDIISYGNARCVVQVGLAEADDIMYVVIALLNVFGGEDGRHTTAEAVAYLVNWVGEVVLVQDLDGFFGMEMEQLVMGTARVIKADEEGKTMCSIVKASSVAANGVDGFLFIKTFTVKELIGSATAFFETRKEVGIEEFVRVQIKNSYIFKIDEEDGEFHHFVDLQACFI